MRVDLGQLYLARLCSFAKQNEKMEIASDRTYFARIDYAISLSLFLSLMYKVYLTFYNFIDSKISQLLYKIKLKLNTVC